MPTLVRRLGLWSSIGIVIGITIGGGIFRTPAGIAARVPDPVWMLSVWIIGGLIVLCGALAFAELAASMPETGGMYVYLREGWGRPYAFLYGWAQLVLIRAAALGGISSVFGEYLSALARRSIRGSIPRGPITWRQRRSSLPPSPTSSASSSVRCSRDSRPSRSSARSRSSCSPPFLLGSDAGGSWSHLASNGAGRGRAVRPGADLGDVGLRRVRRPDVCQRRSQRSAAQSAARDHLRHAR